MAISHKDLLLRPETGGERFGFGTIVTPVRGRDGSIEYYEIWRMTGIEGIYLRDPINFLTVKSYETEKRLGLEQAREFLERAGREPDETGAYFRRRMERRKKEETNPLEGLPFMAA